MLMTEPQKRYERVTWLAQRMGCPSDAAAYHLIRTTPGMGGVLRLGRRVLIDVEKFEAWAASKTT